MLWNCDTLDSHEETEAANRLVRALNDDEEEYARDILESIEIKKIRTCECTKGPVWSAELHCQWKWGEETIIQCSYPAVGPSKQYKVVEGEFEHLLVINAAANCILNKKNALDLLTSYMMEGDTGLSRVKEILRDTEHGLYSRRID